MNNSEKIIRNLLGFPLSRLRCGADLEVHIDGCEMNLKNATLYGKLLKLLSNKDIVVENLDLMYALLRLGVRFSNSSLIGSEYWSMLMNLEYSPKTKVSDDSILLDYLIRHGLELENRDGWRHLALLIDVCYGIPKAKQAVIKLLRSNFNNEIGHLLDNIKDFQQANFLIELLSHCFPRKSTNDVGVVMPPEIRGHDEKDVFFNNPLYPFRGKHGTPQVINFLFDVLCYQIGDVMLVSSVTYHSTGGASSAKVARSSRGDEGGKYFYVQASHDGIYIWDGDGKVLEIDRRHINVSKTGSGDIKISIIGKPSKCFRSMNESWAQQFLRAEWLLLEPNDLNSCDQFLQKIGSVRKVSEVQTFLALNHTDEDFNDRVENTVLEGHQVPDYTSDQEPAKSILPQVEADSRSDKKEQLATPEQSDARICTDEWDFKPSSEQQEPSTSGLQIEKLATPVVGNIVDHRELENDDGSPLVLAQKRKKIRETTKTLEILKKDFAIVNERPSSRDDDCKVLERSPSLLITKFEANTKPVLKKQAVINAKVATPKRNAAQSIAPRDINILDTIFGKPESSTRKKPKRQQRLKNFKPVIEVPSQDLHVPKTKNRKKKECIVSKKENAMATPRSHNPPKQAIHEETTPSTLETPSTAAVKRSAQETADAPKSTKKPKNQETEGPTAKSLGNVSNVETIDNPALDNTELMNSTTILGGMSYTTPLPVSTGNVFTDKLQEQIFSSISHFSNEMVRKVTIINNELNNTIVKELSGKYQKLFQELQASFQNDTEEMLRFVAEIKDMMKLPENELVSLIKSRRLNQ